MRILHLRLKNLNSLVGEWCIDFTHPDYTGNGIFAIIGPTGAGKSTLLDAICLALYGKTPRLDKISKSSNEIMARQTGECYAEVTFETAKGKYRSSWSQRRSGGKAGGNLQNAQREIVDAVTNEVLENQLSRVETKVEEITGMDFQRFTRSMLLAQGSFDAFLKAHPSERAPILEQITGTEIYSKISIKVFERSKDEIKKLNELEALLAAIPLLSEEEESNHRLDYQGLNLESENLTAKLQVLNEQRIWRQEVDRRLGELKAFEQKWGLYISEEKALEPDLKRLEVALKAMRFADDYSNLSHLQKRQTEDLESLSCEMIKKAPLEKALLEKNRGLEESQKKYGELLEEQTRILDVIKQVRRIDDESKREQGHLQLLSESIAREKENILTHRKTLASLQKEIDDYKNSLAECAAYFEKCAFEESLLEKFSLIKDNLNRFKDMNALQASKNNTLNTSQKRLEEAKDLFRGVQAQYDEKKVLIENITKALKAISEEYEEISEGKDPIKWESERKTLESKKMLLLELSSISKAYSSSESKQNSITSLMRSCEERLKKSQENEQSILPKRETLDQKLEALAKQQALQNRIQSLEQDRAQLSDQDPCPLCGSLEHPYAHGNIPNLSEIDRSLIAAKQERIELEKISRAIEKEVHEIEVQLKILSKDWQEEIGRFKQIKEKQLELFQRLYSSSEAYPNSQEVALHLEESEECLKEFESKYDLYLKKGKEKEVARENSDAVILTHSFLKQQLDESLAKQNQCESDFRHLKQEYSQLKSDLGELEQLLLESIRPYGFFTLTDVDAVKEALAERVTNWKNQSRLKKHAEENFQRVHPLILIQKDQVKRAAKLLESLENEKMQQTDRLVELSEQRKVLFGLKNPDYEENELKLRVEKARLSLDELKDDLRRIQHLQESLGNRISELTQTTEARAKTVHEAETKFIEHISQGGFPDVSAYKQASLFHEEREQLAKLKSSLEMQKAELQAEEKAATKRLSELYLEPKTEETLVVLNEHIQEAMQRHERVKERMLALKMLLDDNEKKRQGAKEIQEKVLHQSKETAIWKDLCSLIGAADGKKFRDFAQKMTLEMMIAHANRQLVKMSDRYLLRQSKTMPLELDVVDNYQAGEERSVKNLSGGEGFIVSLSLALGLSQMGSSKVRVDTLFLDEGFGTLDENALEYALNNLAELHQEGKVIGLISHVTVLKDRIATQIRVQPISGGRSRIDGPGCSEVKRNGSA